ncbi:class I SAM-dependent methyltransferase [Breoghania sp. L-A4]|uniref:class I SAM-dependent methyltransferase n=1 Tax=Breoghania sp. L-A4 TaxID=2304600 RepID=UPI000E35DF37|nr:class I SAM-dependent methyltransferase [Breoghania sp. L-A4]AXS40127.1 class I SAM-dependent methyltransferase [Breoghania sp. L-A4]
MSDLAQSSDLELASKADAANADLMDRVYRYQRHVYDLTRKYYLLGRDQLIAALQPPTRGHVLEIGCGTGRNLIAAAEAYPRAQFYGVDISQAMLETARANIARAGLGERIRLAQGDAAGFDACALFGRGDFDRVFFSYALSMIPPWRQALAQGMSLLGPGGRLHVVDFGRQERLPRAFKGLLYAWLKSFHVTPRAAMREAMEGLTAQQDATLQTAAMFRGYAWYGEVRVL